VSTKLRIAGLVGLSVVVLASVAGATTGKKEPATHVAAEAQSEVTSPTPPTTEVTLPATTPPTTPVAAGPSAPAPTPVAVRTPKASPTTRATAPQPTHEAMPPTPASQTLNGTGQTVTDGFPIAGGLTSFKLTHNGSSNFAVWLEHADTGKHVDLLVNEIGPFTGSNQVGLDAGSYVLDISADGPWQVVIDQPRYGSGALVPANFSGHGMTASGPFQVSHTSLVRFQMHHGGSSNFSIWLLDWKGNHVALLANEIGPFDGSKGQSLPAGVYVMQIDADGDWTVGTS
jgi:hypothetical protein